MRRMQCTANPESFLRTVLRDSFLYFLPALLCASYCCTAESPTASIKTASQLYQIKLLTRYNFDTPGSKDFYTLEQFQAGWRVGHPLASVLLFVAVLWRKLMQYGETCVSYFWSECRPTPSPCKALGRAKDQLRTVVQ